MASDLDFGGWDRYDPDEYDDPVDRCPDCRSEVDHYLGCPEDPNPDHEAEAQAQRDLLSQMEGGTDA